MAMLACMYKEQREDEKQKQVSIDFFFFSFLHFDVSYLHLSWDAQYKLYWNNK